MDIPWATDDVPFLTTAQMIEVDRAMMQDYRIDLVRMMENAGRNLAQLARARFLDGDPRGKRVVVLAGTGGNGGGALVCARRLHNYGAQVQIYVSKPAADFAGVPGEQLQILSRMGVAIAHADEAPHAALPHLVVDGVIGYSLRGAPRGDAAVLIHWANATGAPILSLDTPSGLDTATGALFDPVITATATLTLALPKEGLRAAGARAAVGELYLADISVPPELYAEPALGLAVSPLFARNDIVRLW